jgi:hypothetical protein
MDFHNSKIWIPDAHKLMMVTGVLSRRNGEKNLLIDLDDNTFPAIGEMTHA